MWGSDPRPAGPRPPPLPAFGSSGPLAPHGCTAGLCNPAVPDTAPWVWASVTQSHTLTAFLALHSHSLPDGHSDSGGGKAAPFH